MAKAKVEAKDKNSPLNVITVAGLGIVAGQFAFKKLPPVG